MSKPFQDGLVSAPSHPSGPLLLQGCWHEIHLGTGGKKLGKPVGKPSDPWDEFRMNNSMGDLDEQVKLGWSNIGNTWHEKTCDLFRSESWAIWAIGTMKSEYRIYQCRPGRHLQCALHPDQMNRDTDDYWCLHLESSTEKNCYLQQFWLRVALMLLASPLCTGLAEPSITTFPIRRAPIWYLPGTHWDAGLVLSNPSMRSSDASSCIWRRERTVQYPRHCRDSATTLYISQ